MSITLPLTEPPNEVKSHIDKMKGILIKYDFEDVDTELFTLLENIDIVTTDISGFTGLVKRILELFAIEVLSVAKETAEILFQLEMVLLDWIWEVLNTNIHIPFISAVFEFFGIEEFSLLDVICIVPAFGYNLIYRAVKGKSVVNDEEKKDFIKKRITLGYYKTKKEALAALAEYNNNPFNPTDSNLTFAEAYKNYTKTKEYQLLSKSSIVSKTAAYKYCEKLYDTPLYNFLNKK